LTQHLKLGRNSLIFSAIFIIGLTNSLQAQLGAAGSFLRLGVGARAKAMGDAYSGLARGIEASYYNPAGLPFLDKKEVVASYRVLSLDRQFTYLGFGVPIRPKVAGGEQTINGGLALTWIHAGVNNIDGRGSDGGHSDDLSNSENAFMLSFGLRPTQKIAFGLSVKVIWNRFPNIGISGETISANGVGFDLGALLTPNAWLSLGFVVKDINAKYRWNTQDIYSENGSETIDKVPKSLRTAVAIKVPRVKGVTLAIDFEQFFKSRLFKDRIDERLHIGVQSEVRKNIVLRGGLDDGSLTAGGGYQFEIFGKTGQLNYAFSAPGNRPEEEHVFTWVFQF